MLVRVQLQHNGGFVVCDESDVVGQQQSLRDDANRQDSQSQILSIVFSQNSSKPKRDKGQSWRAGQWAQCLPGVSRSVSPRWMRSMFFRVAIMNPT